MNKQYKIEYKDRVLEFNFNPFLIVEDWQREGLLELEYNKQLSREQSHEEMLSIAKGLGWKL